MAWESWHRFEIGWEWDGTATPIYGRSLPMDQCCPNVQSRSRSWRDFNSTSESIANSQYIDFLNLLRPNYSSISMGLSFISTWLSLLLKWTIPFYLAVAFCSQSPVCMLSDHSRRVPHPDHNRNSQQLAHFQSYVPLHRIRFQNRNQ